MENEINQKQTDIAFIKNCLKSGQKITVLGIAREIGTYELKHYIYLLKKQGLKIASNRVTRNKKSFNEYFLID